MYNSNNNSGQHSSFRHNGDLPLEDTAILDFNSAMSTSKNDVYNNNINPERKKKLIQKKQSKRTQIHVTASILLVVIIISLSSLLSYTFIRAALDLTGIAQDEFEIDIGIPEDATIKEIAEILTSHGIINYPEFFIFYANQQESQIYNHGDMTFNSAMTYSSIISKLQSVSTVRETVTIRIQEGMTAKEIGKLLEENSICLAEDFEEYYKNKLDKFNFEKRINYSNFKFLQLEGYLFPDTYQFYVVPQVKERDNSDLKEYARTAAETMYDNFNKKFTKEMYKTINEMDFELDEFITLASMVQREAGTVEDMELVASVFLNRIHDSETFPYLQSDVTHLYADQNIRPFLNSANKSTLKLIIERYDTYASKGLPPGPICNPGMDAMMSIINAPATDYYYFCANEKTLEVFYAKTIEEHENNLILAELIQG